VQTGIIGSNDVQGVTWYTITVNNNDEEWLVQKRYKQFLALDAQLAAGCGLVRIALPEKHLGGMRETAYLTGSDQQRQKELDQYLAYLAQQVQDLSQSPTLACFLQAKTAAISAPPSPTHAVSGVQAPAQTLVFPSQSMLAQPVAQTVSVPDPVPTQHVVAPQSTSPYVQSVQSVAYSPTMSVYPQDYSQQPDTYQSDYTQPSPMYTLQSPVYQQSPMYPNFCYPGSPSKPSSQMVVLVRSAGENIRQDPNHAYLDTDYFEPDQKVQEIHPLCLTDQGGLQTDMFQGSVVMCEVIDNSISDNMKGHKDYNVLGIDRPEFIDDDW